MIELRDCAAKKKSGRLIPIHPSLRTALAAWRKMTVTRNVMAMDGAPEASFVLYPQLTLVQDRALQLLDLGVRV